MRPSNRRAAEHLETIDGRTVLVTGGAGFIGSRLAAALEPAAEVRVLDDLSTGHRDKVPAHATLIEGSICDDETVDRATEDIDLIFHQAAVVSVGRSIEAPTSTHTVNVSGTLRLLEAARQEDARIICASSAAVYGPPDRLPIREDDRKRPTSPYGIAKLAADQYCRRYNDLYGLETVALRYFNVYGPGQAAGGHSGVIEIFRQNALAGEDLVIHGDGSQTRDFVHVDDVVMANLQAASTDHLGTAVNVATGEAITINTLAKLIREYTESDSPIRWISSQDGDIDRSCADLTKAKQVLAYEPSVSIESGLERLVAESARGPSQEQAWIHGSEASAVSGSRPGSQDRS